jgi:hypothetical protein
MIFLLGCDLSMRQAKIVVKQEWKQAEQEMRRDPYRVLLLSRPKGIGWKRAEEVNV